MARLAFRSLVMLLTFTVGLASAKLWLTFRHPSAQSVVRVDLISSQNLQPQLITFEDTEVEDMFLSYYLASDGKTVRYGCFERKSASQAIAELPAVSDRDNRVVEHGPKLSDKGVKVGERIVQAPSTDAVEEAAVKWTEGARVFYIYAPSLWHALAFERSKAWTAQHCIYVSWR